MIRVVRGKGRESDRPAAILWSAILLGIAGLAGAALLAAGRWAILWLAIPALAILLVTLALSARIGARQAAVEIIGVIGLALAAPAAYAAATGSLDFTGWVTWGLSALHNVISVLYVRLRIDIKHDRASDTQAWSVAVAHVASLAVVLGVALAGWMPWLVAAPIGVLLGRALYVAWRKPPLENVKRFGFTEMGLALGFAAIVIAAFFLAR
jgi:hypothetical protein